MDADILQYVFHHVFLPPRLPGEPESKQKSLETELLHLVKRALASFLEKRTWDIQDKWKPAVSIIDIWLTVDAGGVDLNRHQEALQTAIKDLRNHGAIAFYISAQNCGWMAYYDSGRDKVIIDAFEASATSAAVLKAQGSLIRCFPGQSIAIPATMIDDIAFCKYLAYNLCRLNLEVVRDMCPKASESRESIEEIRDTVHPGLLTEGLMVQLLPFGEHNVHKCFEKHMRDEITYDGNKIPWRRSPLWFVIKVALQTVLYRNFPDIEGRTEYKNFMLYLISELGFLAKGLEVYDIADILAIMLAKIARRVHKLRDETFEFVMQRVEEVDAVMLKRLQQLQLLIQSADKEPLPQGFGHIRESDLATSLKHSEDYLRDAFMHQATAEPRPRFSRDYKPRKQRQANGLPRLNNDEAVCLLDFEAWVDEELESWRTSLVKSTKKVCTELADLISKYSSFANSRYAQMPDSMSLATLVIMELWVSLDKLCTQICPLLKEFSPEIPRDFLNPLLLPHRRQMQRAQNVEDYLLQRHQDCNADASVFADPGPDTFAARYFDRNQTCKQLHQEITSFATQEREDRRKLWQERSDTYQELLSQAEDLSHETDFNEWNQEIHDASCEKCQQERKAANMQIEVHEWPLPADEELVKNIVFELRCPRWFAQWRDITWKIVDDYGRPQTREFSKMHMNLLDLPATKHFASILSQRLTLASSTMSWLNTHYRSQNFPVNFTTIAVPSSFKWSLWDSEREVWVASRRELSQPSIKYYCTLTVNDPDYCGLQYAVHSPRHKQNKVIADQRDCPTSITLHEMSAFGHIRSGEYLQWYNITRELASPTVSLNKDPFHKLFCQAAWELGSSDTESSLRKAHAFFEETSSVNRLLKSLEQRLDGIGMNWNEHYTLHTLVVLGLRVLSLCLNSAVERSTLFLKRCRRTAMDWCASLSQGFEAKTGSDSDTKLALLFKIAGVSLLTFAAESQHLPLLLESTEDLTIFFRSSIVLFQNTPKPAEDHTLETKTMNLQATRTLHDAERQVSKLIELDPSALDKAIREAAGDYQITSDWQFESGERTRWVVSEISMGGDKQEIRYNILSGELLIDNEPPGRLPESYTKHPLFQRLFGQRTLSVVTSKIRGSNFETNQLFGVYKVHFRLDGTQLVIKAREDGQAKEMLQLIPHDILLEDFPDSLITGHAHWLNLETGLIEFRPLDQTWHSRPQNWQMLFQQRVGETSTTRQGQRRLVDVHSSLFARISDVLRRLDDPKHIRVEVNEEGRIEAKLVRLRLDFYVNAEGLLECQEHNATVDPNQDIGCLYGLFNKLVLRSKAELSQRHVLIPFGTVKFNKGPLYTKVSIEAPKGPRIRCLNYIVDTTLGVLSNATGLMGGLYQAYLHAVTSFVLPSTMSGRSGTEEALRILRQARMKTSLPLDNDCFRLLELIGTLTPRRQYHPPGIEMTQRVTWIRDLGMLAQHDDFWHLSKAIFAHAKKLAPFYEPRKEISTPLGLDRGDPNLLRRAQLRHSQFHKVEFGGASDARCVEPAHYEARDRKGHNSDRGRRVYEIAARIRQWPLTRSCKEDFLSTVKSWGAIDLQIRALDQYSHTLLIECPLSKIWGSLYSQCRKSNKETDTYKLISAFCTMAFGESKLDSKYDKLKLFLDIAFSGGFPEIPRQLLQETVRLSLSPGQRPEQSEVQKAISKHYFPYKTDFGIYAKSLTKAEKRKMQSDQKKDYERKKKQRVEALASHLVQQWPGTLEITSDMEGWQAKALGECKHLFSVHDKNALFFELVEQIHNKLDAIPIYSLGALQPPEYPKLRPLIWPRTSQPDRYQAPSLYKLLRSTRAPSPMDVDGFTVQIERNQVHVPFEGGSQDNLQSLVSGLCQNCTGIRQEYAKSLMRSVEALEQVHVPSIPTDFHIQKEVLVQYRNRLSDQRDSLWAQIKSALTRADSAWKVVASSTLWPSVTILSILSFLAGDKWPSVPDSWKSVLLSFARCISYLRRSRRLLGYFENQDVSAFCKEAETIGWEGWETAENPDWLLLEIESDLTIRERQTEIAHQMIASESKENAVLQLNMGEGKTTVITPMIAACLSDGSQMLRIIVLKPLLRQSIDLLSQRLGGLLNRPIYHIPFSRSTRINAGTVDVLRDIYSECQRERGILITLPEQLLSFHLVSLDLASDEACDLVEVERALQDNCRTIIDESDEVLDSKFQLIYTRGAQQNLDGESDRWEVIQYVLEIVQDQALALQEEDSSSLTVEHQDNRYPLMHFLKSDAPGLLLRNVIKAITKGKIPGLPFLGWSQQVRESAEEFIANLHATSVDTNTVRDTFKESTILRKLLVLRGLFAHGVLSFALAGKRWLVDYGVHLSRCLMAVPFRAKGVPSENAEFGHADVALTLTCLSYYYIGLTEDQMRQSFSILLKENDPLVEYKNWICRCRDRLPEALQSFSAVNLEDKQSFETLYQCLRYQKGVLDFFLAKVVFPREAKEFPFKLSTSAWNIPSRPGQPLTTGFSGTNDNRYLLPKSMSQRDLPYLLHTNAMVLNQLLRKENRQCILAEDARGHQLTVVELLRMIKKQDPPIQVLVDVGAQILESSNQEVAQLWLKEVTVVRAQAAVFFNENDEPMVVDRDGYVERLLASSYRGRMHLCLVFLDQHHARGVDLKLPQDYRAAVTLGPRLTKDRLVQACHRMRGLDNGQSVAFVIPPEVKNSMTTNDSAQNATFTSFEVIKWVLEQTCIQLEKLQPLWAWQGLQYYRCLQIWDEFRMGTSTLQDIVPRIQESESKSLSQLYAPWGDSPYSLDTIRHLALEEPKVEELLNAWNQANSTTTALLEEQEREITQEIQREQHICRPPFVESHKHEFNSDLKHFVKHGYFPSWFVSGAVQPAFDILSRTSASQFRIPKIIEEHLYATTDFLTTITKGASPVEDEFLKPVHWILSNTQNANPTLLILSQYEANKLLPYIRKSENTTLHMYAPRTTRDMISFSKLDFLTIGAPRPPGLDFPPDLLQALEIFSGSLYFDTFDEYINACHFFGFITDNSLNLGQDAVSSDGFVDKRTRDTVGWPVKSPFSSSPLPFLKCWYGIRMKGHGFSQSHVGSIVEARRLTIDRFS